MSTYAEFLEKRIEELEREINQLEETGHYYSDECVEKVHFQLHLIYELAKERGPQEVYDDDSPF